MKKSGLSQEAFVRSLINGYIPKPLPSLDYHALIRELHATGHLEKEVFQQEADQLRRADCKFRRP